MALLEIKDVSFRYPEEAFPTLKNLSFSVNTGEFVVLCGPSGCGKTTLLRQLKKELQPAGDLSGQIMYKGIPLTARTSITVPMGAISNPAGGDDHLNQRMTQEIGMVTQDPDNQIVMDEVLQELAFSLENIGVPMAEMRKRIAEMCHFFGMEPWLHKPIDECSGGQKQVVNLASVLLLQPNVLLLDEPTAQLDPVAARELLQIVHRLNQELAMTVIISEHRLEEVFPLADKVIVLDKGSIAYEGSPQQVIESVGSGKDARFMEYLPSVSKLYLSCRRGNENENDITDTCNDGIIPQTVREGRVWLQRKYSEPGESQLSGAPSRKKLGQVGERGCRQLVDNSSPVATASSLLLECREVTFQYGKDEPLVLNRLSLALYPGDFLALLGGNGSGKSTLLQTMVGLLTPQRGSVYFGGKKMKQIKDEELYNRVGYLVQNPLLYFAHDTVEGELLHAALRAGADHPEEDVREMLALFGIEAQRSKHPYDCSGGERQKVALAGVLLSKPQLLLLDEPTKGLDPISKLQLASYLTGLHKQGLTMMMVTHDVEFAAKYANRCAMLFDGSISSEGLPQDFFSDNYFYTTTINRMVRHRFPKALTYEDVLRQWNAPVLP